MTHRQIVIRLDEGLFDALVDSARRSERTLSKRRAGD